MKNIKLADIVVIVVVIVCAAVIFACFSISADNSRSDALQVNVNGEITIYSLDKNTQFDLCGSNGETLRVIIENRCVFVSESSCHDKICENTGKISKSGEIIVCAPARIILKITGDGDDFVDNVAG